MGEVTLDLVLGRVNTEHPLYAYLKNNGATDDALYWFQDHPETIDLLGLDYYIHSEMEWFGSNGQSHLHTCNERPRGFAAIAE